MDWDDTIGEFFDAIDRVKLPSNLVVPFGEEGIWLLNLTVSQAHGRFTDPFDLNAPMRDLLAEAMRRRRIAVCPSEDRPAAIQLQIFRAVS